MPDHHIIHSTHEKKEIHLFLFNFKLKIISQLSKMFYMCKREHERYKNLIFLNLFIYLIPSIICSRFLKG